MFGWILGWALVDVDSGLAGCAHANFHGQLGPPGPCRAGVGPLSLQVDTHRTGCSKKAKRYIDTYVYTEMYPYT